MNQTIHIQHQFCSIHDVQRLCSIDNEIITDRTQLLIHQSARFLFIRSGNAVLRIQGQTYELTEGTIAMIFPWEITEVVSVKQTLSYAIVKYNFDILNYFLKAQVPMEGNSSLLTLLEQRHVVHCSPSDWNQIQQLLKLLEEELGMESVTVEKTDNSYSNIFCSSLLVQLIILMYRSCQESRNSAPEEHEKVELLRYMYLHLESKISVQTLSQVFYISQSSVRRYIHAMTGLTFNELLNVMRIAKTANYLLYTDMTLEELAELFGFVDTSHISKIFQARVGMKVNEYRKIHQNVQQLCGIHESRTDYSVVNYIFRNYTQDLKIQEVASLYATTPQELNRMLLYQVGKNFGDFLNKIRIDHAYKLLLESDYSIADIALRVGYNSIKTFNRNFVNITLMTPSTFRRTVTMQTDKK